MGKFEDKFANKPFRPAKFRFFYGWIVVGAAAAGVLMSMPGQTLGIAAFKNLMRDALGVSDLQISRAYMFGTIASSFLLTPAGRLLDRLGARIVAPAAVRPPPIRDRLTSIGRTQEWTRTPHIRE